MILISPNTGMVSWTRQTLVSTCQLRIRAITRSFRMRLDQGFNAFILEASAPLKFFCRLNILDVQHLLGLANRRSRPIRLLLRGLAQNSAWLISNDLVKKLGEPETCGYCGQVFGVDIDSRK
jgi:hypothetical protein